ncbi:hypothetical protein [Nocardia pneumoniae]|uniref:hypothetical protein n=1 Tax=Nocardia pneumoniae TaxID=228601 RepID=UPI00031728E3|nr:hypothetical protein [Nocardia pneumoniae]
MNASHLAAGAHRSPAVTEAARPARATPQALGFSALTGTVFAAAWFGYAAVRAEDGRNPVTDWLDPMLAAATITLFVVLQAVVILLWSQLPVGRFRGAIAAGLVAGQWMYVVGEVLSNTITIGQPPEDIGSLFEITGGFVTLAASLALTVAWAGRSPRGRSTFAVGGIAVAAALGTVWWFTHAIDQGQPGAPDCVPGNPVYNITHGHSC